MEEETLSMTYFLGDEVLEINFDEFPFENLIKVISENGLILFMGDSAWQFSEKENCLQLWKIGINIY